MPAEVKPAAKGGPKTFRVLVTDPVAEPGLALLRRHPAFVVEERLKIAPADLKKALLSVDALIIRSETKVTADVMPQNGTLKVIGRAGVGVDNVDVEAATRAGILVMNAPEGNTIAAAEHAMALMLSALRNVPRATASLKAGEWKRSKFTGREMFRKTLGVVGLGRIGAEVAKRAASFGMEVIGSDPMLTAERARELGAELVEVKDIIRRADVITLHAPLTPRTRHMLGAKEFAGMKKGVVIVNCARGGLIDEAALAAAIHAGRVGAAAIDVFEQEPPAPTNPLLKLEQVVVTPHLGASTEEAQVNVSTVVAEQIRDYLVSGLVRNAVNAPATAPEALSVLGPYLNLAERMGRFIVQLSDGAPRKLEVEARGELAAKANASLAAAAVKGALSIALRERVNVVNARALARDRGIEVAELTSPEADEFASLIRVTLTTSSERRSMDGTIIGRDEPHVVAIDGLHLDIVPQGTMITFTNVDRPGIVGRVGTILGKAKINIAGLHLGRIAIGKKAVSIFSVDNAVDPAVLKELAKLPELTEVRVVTI